MRIFYLLIAALILPGVLFANEVGTVTPELSEAYGLDPDFFGKATLAEGILIASSPEVSDGASPTASSGPFSVSRAGAFRRI